MIRKHLHLKPNAYDENKSKFKKLLKAFGLVWTRTGADFVTGYWASETEKVDRAHFDSGTILVWEGKHETDFLDGLRELFKGAEEKTIQVKLDDFEMSDLVKRINIGFGICFPQDASDPGKMKRRGATERIIKTALRFKNWNKLRYLSKLQDELSLTTKAIEKVMEVVRNDKTTY